MSQKVALITGTNQGIGKALSLEFYKRNYKVYSTDQAFSNETLEEFKKLGIHTQIVDVTKLDDIISIRDRILEENDGKLDVLYSNAGIVKVSHAAEIKDEDLQKIYEVNVFANVKIVREFVKLLINSRGTVIFSGSVTKDIPLHSNALYTSSKSALDQYAQVLHSELKNYGVRVINVIGGYIKTSIFDSGANTVSEDSIYNFKDYTDRYAKRIEISEKNVKDGMEPTIFAQRVLDQVENSNKHVFRIFEGSKSSSLYLASNILSTRKLVDNILNLFNLNFDYRKHLKNDRLP